MNALLQIWMAAAVIVVGYILGFYFNHRLLGSFRSEFNAKFEALRTGVNAKFEASDAKIEALRAEMRQGFAELRLEFHTQISDLSHRLDRVEERLNLVQRQ
jgi:hypothetical protein